jgi:hypothetical protein
MVELFFLLADALRAIMARIKAAALVNVTAPALKTALAE